MNSCLRGLVPILTGWLLAVEIVFAPPASAGNFELWLQDLGREAVARGVSPATLETALSCLKPIPRVLELERSQPEFELSLGEYLTRMTSRQRIQTAQRKLEEQRPLLEAVEARFGVEPPFLVALWAIESGFGRRTGGFPVIGALATLAHEGRRQAFFREELLTALAILDQGHVRLEDLVGSWAGAMGPFQFIPSSFWNFAVDYDGDGRRDIWTDEADAFASAANYLAVSGWRKGEGWGGRVQLPEGFEPALAGLRNRKSLGQWRKLGILQAEGPDHQTASLILPEGAEGPAFLVYENFQVLLRWNRSVPFALAVGYLADQISRRTDRQQ